MSEHRGVYIGGSGRSGTTILSKVLNKHSKIHSLPFESRFITDPDGLYSLYNSLLVENWSFFQSDFAIERFLTLMGNLKYRYLGKYPNFGISKYVNFYDDWVHNYIQSLGVQTFKSSWAARTGLLQKIISKKIGKNNLTNKFLNDSFYISPVSKHKFFDCTNKFLQDYYTKISINTGKNIVVDHTPSNILYPEFLRDIDKNSRLIHIYRNPLDTICSFQSKDWGAKNNNINVRWIFDTLELWKEKKKKLDPNLYVEVKFEDLIREPKSTCELLSNYIGIDFEDEMLTIDLSNHNINRWQNQLDANTLDYIISNYSNEIIKMGYEI